MMTLDEAIRHAEEVAEDNKQRAGFETDCETYSMAWEEREKCRECANDHRQLAEWLKELKELRGKYARLRRECNEVIDEICRLREGRE